MIRFRPAAARELAADFRDYEKDYPGRGRRFVEAIDQMLMQIEMSPTRFPVTHESEVRSAKVGRFPTELLTLWSMASSM